MRRLLRHRPGHAQGREDVLVQIGRIGLAAHRLDDGPEHHEVGVAVLKGRARRAVERVAGQTEGEFGHRVRTGRAGVDHRLVSRLVRDAADLVQQGANRDGLRRRGAVQEARQIARRRSVQRDPSGLSQLQDRQRGKGLGRRAEDERGVGRHRPALAVVAEAAGIGRVVAMDDGHGHAGQVRALEQGRDVGIDARRSRRRGPGGAKRAQRQQQGGARDPQSGHRNAPRRHQPWTAPKRSPPRSKWKGGDVWLGAPCVQ